MKLEKYLQSFWNNASGVFDKRCFEGKKSLNLLTKLPWKLWVLRAISPLYLDPNSFLQTSFFLFLQLIYKYVVPFNKFNFAIIRKACPFSMRCNNWVPSSSLVFPVVTFHHPSVQLRFFRRRISYKYGLSGTVGLVHARC